MFNTWSILLSCQSPSSYLERKESSDSWRWGLIVWQHCVCKVSAGVTQRVSLCADLSELQNAFQWKMKQEACLKQGCTAKGSCQTQGLQLYLQQPNYCTDTMTAPEGRFLEITQLGFRITYRAGLKDHSQHFCRKFKLMLWLMQVGQWVYEHHTLLCLCSYARDLGTCSLYFMCCRLQAFWSSRVETIWQAARPRAHHILALCERGSTSSPLAFFLSHLLSCGWNAVRSLLFS